jgi:hypothetical protein
VVRSVALALYADSLAGEAAALAARSERIRSRLEQAGIERAARAALPRATIGRLELIGVFQELDEREARAELRELAASLRALAELQAWVERQLDEAVA